MDNLTHSLFGLTLAATPLGRVGRGATATLLLASNAPDIDIVATAGGAMNYLHWHRGPTHGLLGVVGLGFITAAIVSIARRSLERNNPVRPDPPATFLALWAIAIVGIICHVLMDLPTSYGTRPLSPFDWHWYAEDWLPIVDIYLLAILGGTLWFGSRGAFPGARGRNAAVALLLMTLNYGVRAVSHHQALDLAPRLFGPLLPERCAGAPPPHGWIDSWPLDRPHASTRCLIEIAAMPSFVSPFHWRLVAHMSNGYEVQGVNVLDRRFHNAPAGDEVLWRTTIRYPNQWTPHVAQAADTRAAQEFLAFSRFPSVRSILDDTGGVMVRWRDIRFVAEEFRGRTQRADLFTLTVRLDPGGRLVEERLGP